MKNKKLMNKKAAGEVFNLVLPILLFILLGFVFYLLFSFVNHFTQTASQGFDADYYFIHHDSIRHFISHKEKINGYDVSMYEIFYYGNRDNYRDYIINYLEYINNIYVLSQKDTFRFGYFHQIDYQHSYNNPSSYFQSYSFVPIFINKYTSYFSSESVIFGEDKVFLNIQKMQYAIRNR